MSKITNIDSREILDSRGYPTVEVEITLSCGTKSIASVPSGASTGSLEALELRDKDSRYHGKGVLKAVDNVKSEISQELIGIAVNKQRYIDHKMIELDGTPNKSRLGANAILGVSLAVAKAAAKSYKLPLYQYIGGVNSYKLPRPMINIINGGAHADNNLDFQEFMIMPNIAPFSEAIRISAEIFYCLRELLKSAGHNVNVGDEGGFAPNFNQTEQALDFIIAAITKAGFSPGKQIHIAIDSAASEFYRDKFYHLKGTNQKLTSEQLINYYENLVNNYPVSSIEDALSESDNLGWQLLTKKLGNRVQLIGDDLFVTNPNILLKGIEDKLANAILIKPNQVGTLSETLDAIEIAHKAGYKTIISHRSGETEDSFIAHLAVATNSGQIKTGSLSRSDRLAKYNELLRIEQQLNS